MRLLFLCLLPALPLAAEFRSIEIGVSGLDCASCAQSIDKRLLRIRGVESASFRAETSVVVLELKLDNTVTLERVRDALKGLGYTPGMARVRARGRIESKDGEMRFRLTGVDREYRIEGPAKPAGETMVEGEIAASGDTLRIKAQ